MKLFSRKYCLANLFVKQKTSGVPDAIMLTLGSFSWEPVSAKQDFSTLNNIRAHMLNRVLAS